MISQFEMANFCFSAWAWTNFCSCCCSFCSCAALFLPAQTLGFSVCVWYGGALLITHAHDIDSTIIVMLLILQWLHQVECTSALFVTILPWLVSRQFFATVATFTKARLALHLWWQYGVELMAVNGRTKTMNPSDVMYTESTAMCSVCALIHAQLPVGIQTCFRRRRSRTRWHCLSQGRLVYSSVVLILVV